MALVVNDEPLTIKRICRGFVYRFGAIPRGGVDVQVGDLRQQLASKQDEVELLRLELDVTQSDARRREERLTTLERRVDSQDAVIEEYLGATATLCTYLVRDIEVLLDRLRASS